MISIRKFTYWYPETNQPALRKVDLEISSGEFVGIVGANGAGKSTLCSAISGFVPLFYYGDWDGEISLNGKVIADSSLGELAGRVGLVFQNPFNQISGARFTVREEIAFGLENLGLPKPEMEKRIRETMKLVGIEDLANRSPFALSGGQQQRVAIASILAMRPKVLVLDEPTSQLDPRGTQEVFAVLRSLVRQGGITVVMAEHKLEWLATFADRIVALDHGRIAMLGKPEHVLSSPAMVRLNIGRTQYSEVAGRVRPSKRLPVTLDEAKAYLR